MKMKEYIKPIIECETIRQAGVLCGSYADPNQKGGGGDTNGGKVF